MSESSLGVRVECEPGHRGEPEPRRFYFNARRVEVVELLDRWLATDHRYFKLLADDGGTYILRHDTSSDRWELTLFSRDSL